MLPFQPDAVVSAAAPIAILSFTLFATLVAQHLFLASRRLTSDGEKLLSLLGRVRSSRPLTGPAVGSD